jgi:hypothetical protein
LDPVWPCWRLWAEGKATKEALETTWSIDDIADANDVLDAWHEAESELAKKPPR